MKNMYIDARKAKFSTILPARFMLSIRIARIGSHALDGELPSYATPGSSGMDLRAAVDNDLIIVPGERALVPTGLMMEIPRGFEGQVRPRSGLAVKHGVSVLNAPGTIDADYRGEVKVILINFGKDDFLIKRGDRIAQLVVCPVVAAVWEEVELLDATERGSGGFGHTGR